MKKSTFILLAFTLISPFSANGAVSCSRASLTRCLDSACAINLSSNAAARCQYCGSSSAGTPPTGAMRSVSVGQSSKNTITDKELKNAPTDPGERYAWATGECIKKIPGCTPDDVSETYDSLIEQSCRAAGINAQMATLQAAARKTKTKTECNTDILSCITNAKKCGPDYRACENDADFNKFFAACGAESAGCDDYIGDIRTGLIAARDNAVKNADILLASITKSYQNARESKLSAARQACTDNAGRDSCVATVCANNMRNKCGVGYESEKSMAIQLCKFYEIACATLK